MIAESAGGKRNDEWIGNLYNIHVGNGHFTCVNGNCSELAPHSQTLCSTTRIANLWWATHCAWLQLSISSADKCEWTRCSSSSKHSAASPKHPNGKRRPANGPLANARLNASGHSAGSELVCSCWNNSWNELKRMDFYFLHEIAYFERSRKCLKFYLVRFFFLHFSLHIKFQ